MRLEPTHLKHPSGCFCMVFRSFVEELLNSESPLIVQFRTGSSLCCYLSNMDALFKIKIVTKVYCAIFLTRFHHIKASKRVRSLYRSQRSIINVEKCIKCYKLAELSKLFTAFQ